jgi:hypothetical protein
MKGNKNDFKARDQARWPRMFRVSRLSSMPEVGPITASLRAMEMGDGSNERGYCGTPEAW